MSVELKILRIHLNFNQQSKIKIQTKHFSMIKIYYFAAIIILSSCIGNANNGNIKKSDEITILKYEGLFELLNQKNDVLYVVNFWATWCSPCVEELPTFVAVDQDFRKNNSYKMFLVSLDAATDIEEVKTFVHANNVSAQVLLLDDISRMNKWIPMVETYWGGAIPATLFFKNGKSLKFVEGKLTKNELVSHINKHL